MFVSQLLTMLGISGMFQGWELAGRRGWLTLGSDPALQFLVCFFMHEFASCSLHHRLLCYALPTIMGGNPTKHWAQIKLSSLKLWICSVQVVTKVWRTGWKGREEWVRYRGICCRDEGRDEQGERGRDAQTGSLLEILCAAFEMCNQHTRGWRELEVKGKDLAGGGLGARENIHVSKVWKLKMANFEMWMEIGLGIINKWTISEWSSRDGKGRGTISIKQE